MKYIKLFDSEIQYDLVSEDFIYPTVSFLEAEDEVRYMAHDYSRDYLTFEALEDCVFTISSVAQYGNPTMTKSMRESFSYSIDGGRTWVTYTTPDGGITTSGTTALLTTPTIHAGEKVLWKGIGTQNYLDYLRYNAFTSTGNFKAYGNMMTILYGDDGFETTRLAANWAMSYFFKDNTKLIDASNLKLPATTLASSYYSNMFYGCTSLTTAPELPATTLANNCYGYMFNGCTSLTTAPELPATTLTQNCYYQMFYNCTSLTTAPELPATTLANSCYYQMFNGCSSLNYIKAMFTTTPGSSYTNAWVNGVAATGTFIKNGMATWDVTGVHGIPTGWTVNKDSDTSYLTFEALEDCVFTISTIAEYAKPAMPRSMRESFSYSVDDGETWVTYNTPDDGITAANGTALLTTPTIHAGEKVLWKGIGVQNYLDYSRQNTFTSTGDYKVYGNVMTLLYGDSGLAVSNFQGDNSWALAYLFADNTHLIDVSDLVLPATTLTNSCYGNMFNGCTSLTTAPSTLPATTLASSCYSNMFRDCTSLTTAPELPATTLASNCYRYMFNGCTALIDAPKLPATTLAQQCYQYMFTGCTLLTIAPELPATTLAQQCYQYMFQDCTSLTIAPELPATTLAVTCYYQMFQGCTSLTTVPELPATTLVDYCYYQMFQGCTNLNYIKAMFTTTPSSTYTDNWVNGVASTGTFVKNSAAQWNVTGTNAIPSGWTVETASS